MKMYKARYSVSPFGSVYDNKTGSWLVNYNQSAGYVQVLIYGKLEYLHRVVAISHIGEYPNLEVDHIDHNKKNNSITNLQWVTRLENMKRYYSHRSKSGQRSHRQKHRPIGSGRLPIKLNISQVEEIRNRLSEGEYYSSIAIDFGISKAMVCKIHKGKAWLKNRAA